MTEVKERPILFSGEMIRAILNGRKSQTRRVIKDKIPDNAYLVEYSQDDHISEFHRNKVSWFVPDAGDMWPCNRDECFPCPFGKIGEKLWVRETFGFVDESFEGVDWIPDRPAKKVKELKFGKGYCDGYVIYAADGNFAWAKEDSMEECTLWKPSIHMPRAASRITLEITDVRVERLQDISEEDAMAEGVNPYDPTAWFTRSEMGEDFDSFQYRSGFFSLWSEIYGLDSYRANPFVWCISFKRIK